MTALLASVTSPAEVDVALAGGADVIDLKDPSQGALGALPVSEITACVARVAGRRWVSATVGDLAAEPRQVRDAVLRTAATGVDVVKLGLFGPGDWDACLGALPLADIRLVAVLFADQDPDWDRLPRLAQCGVAGVMLDTATKGGPSLPQLLDARRLCWFTQWCRGQSLLSGLAGSLTLTDISVLLDARPDYLGFRTALCAGGDRGGDLDSGAVAAVRARIPRACPALLDRRTA